MTDQDRLHGKISLDTVACLTTCSTAWRTESYVGVEWPAGTCLLQNFMMVDATNE